MASSVWLVYLAETCSLRDWRDPSWTGVQSVKSGLAAEVQQQRRVLFGANVIDIEGKSTISLAIDEVGRCNDIYLR